MKPQHNSIVFYKDKNKTNIEVRFTGDTVWVNQSELSVLFETERSVITKHIRNIFSSGELDEKSNVQKMHIAGSDKPVKTYNLDVVLSVGYRVNSKKATQFRIWANKILHDYLIKGYSYNEKRLKEHVGRLAEFEKAVSYLHGIVESKLLNKKEALGLLDVITDYASSWLLLERYDEKKLTKTVGTIYSDYILTYEDVMEMNRQLKNTLITKKQASEFFGIERENGIDQILGAINQSFGGNDLYPTVEEKAAHLLYFIIKDHPFTDGNKRIGSFLFIVYLSRCGGLFRKNGERKINDNALVAIAILIAESNPNDKDTMIALITYLLQ